jgi:RNA polymerase sigma factor (sigma-70 family)
VSQLQDDKANHPTERALKWLLKDKVTPADRERAAEELFDTSFKRVTLGWLMYRCRLSDADAEELFVDAVMRFIQSQKLPKQGAARAWFLKVLTNVVKDRFRSKGAQKRGGGQQTLSISAGFEQDQEQGDDGEGAPDFDIVSDQNVEEQVATRQVLEASLNVLSDLPPACLEALELAVWGMKMNEIADELGISVSAVKDRLYRCRQAVRGYFKE